MVAQKILFIFFISFFSIITQNANARAQELDKTQLDKIVSDFFDFYFEYNPTAGTLAGFHQYDTKLEDYSKAAILSQSKQLRVFLKRLAELDYKKLDVDSEIDREFLISKIRAYLLELERVKNWEKNPDLYGSQISPSVYSIISRSFAPPADRLRSVIARERQLPRVFVEAKKNLKNPPRIFTEVALEQLSGTIDFFKNDVPTAFKDVQDKALLDEFRSVNSTLISELEKYQAYLKEKILPESKGDFRLGAKLYSQKLLFDDMVDTKLNELLKIGYENLRANQRWFKETAAKIDPKKTFAQILEEMMRDHPTADKLLDSVRGLIVDIKNFLPAHQIVTIPSPVLPIIQETPTFGRALDFASMDTPGAYETKATEAYFNITPPEPSWPPKRIEEHLQGFNRPVLVSTSIHEAYPGHYIQFLWVPHIASKVRKLLTCNTNVEGWAHYTEQMMLDEGYGGGDLKLRLGQLQDALLRNARFIVGIEMHTGKMTFEQGIDFFVNEGYQSRTNGERETRRGTFDPTYLYYTLGKLQILKLRDQVKAQKGSEFSLREFHDEFLKQGPIPVKLIERTTLKKPRSLAGK